MSQFDYSAHRIEKIRTQILQELEDLKELPDYYHPDIQEHVAYLRNRIKLDQKEASAKSRGAVASTSVNTDIEVHWTKLTSRIFRLEWKKLKEYHKILQIRAFVGALVYPSGMASEDEIAENRVIVEDTIVLGLTTSRFVKKKSTIEYDPDEMKVTSISCLELDEDTGLYTIDWDK